MKHAIILALLLSFISARSQSNLSNGDVVYLNHFFNEVQKVIKDHKCSGNNEAKIVSWSTLDTLFKPIFSKIIFGNNDVVNQGLSYALNVSQFDAQFNINHTIAADKSHVKGGYFNLGLNASSSNKNYLIFIEIITFIVSRTKKTVPDISLRSADFVIAFRTSTEITPSTDFTDRVSLLQNLNINTSHFTCTKSHFISYYK